MVKSVVVTLTGDIPDAALETDAIVKINDVEYAGKVSAIIVYPSPSAVPPTTSVTLTGPGLVAET